jgi:hypothetical protein
MIIRSPNHKQVRLKAEGEVPSEVIGGFYDHSSLSVNVYNFFIDHIVDHHRLNLDSELCEAFLDRSAYTAGVPTDGFPPIEHLFEYANPFFGSCSSVLLGEDGVFNFPGEETAQRSDAGVPVAVESPPEDVEFLIK